VVVRGKGGTTTGKKSRDGLHPAGVPELDAPAAGFSHRLCNVRITPRRGHLYGFLKAVMKPIPKRARNRPRSLIVRRSKNRPSRSRPEETPARNPVRRRRAVGRPTRKGTRRPRAVTPPPAQAIPDARQVQDVLDQLARAQAELTARGIDLLNVAHAIGRNAVATFKQELVNSLVQDNLLHDLEQLRTALAATPLSADLRLLPEATLNWLCRHLDLNQHLQPEQELEVPTDRLRQYDLEGPPPDAAKTLVRLQVIAPGWKYRGKSVIRPRVVVAAPPVPAANMLKCSGTADRLP
jgi:hypothetical protein